MITKFTKQFLELGSVVPDSFAKTEQFSRASAYDRQDLQRYNKTITGLIKDVWFVINQMKQRVHGKPPTFCVDFDVLFAASEWSGDDEGDPFWSAMLVYLETNRHSILPGTLFEALRYFSDPEKVSRPYPMGSFGKSLVNAINNNQVSNEKFAEFSEGASYKFVAAKYFKQQLLHIFAMLQNQCEVLEKDVLGEVDPSRQKLCVNLLQQFHLRNEKHLNNRVDSINLSLANQINLNGGYKGSELVLVANSITLRKLQNSLVSRYGSDRWVDCVWGVRAAAIYQTLIAIEPDYKNAKNLAYELSSQLYDRHRFVDACLDDLNEGETVSVKLDRHEQSAFSMVLSSMQRIDEKLHARVQEAFSNANSNTGQAPIGVDHEQLRKEVVEQIQNQIDDKKLNSYNDLVEYNDSPSKITKVNVELPKTGLGYWQVEGEADALTDHVIAYSDKIMVGIDADQTALLQFAHALNDLRDSIVANEMLSADLSNSVNIKEIAEVGIRVCGREFLLKEVDLEWKHIAGDGLNPEELEDDRATPDQNHQKHDLTKESAISARVHRVLNKAFLHKDGAKIDFFRLKTKYIDASYEHGYYVISIYSEEYEEQLSNLFKHLSANRVDDFGKKVYSLAAEVGGLSNHAQSGVRES